MNVDLRWAVDSPPIGIWTTVLGTADVLENDALCLLPDGTGSLRSWSVVHGEETLPLMWKHVQPGTLSISVIYDLDEEQAWQTVEYCSTVVQIDAGGAHVQVLRNIDDKQFWTLVGPIKFVSPVPAPQVSP